MPLNAETAVRTRIWKPLALLALAVMACTALAGCGGGGSGGGEQVMIVPSSPDLVVESVKASDDGPAAGANFTLSVTVRNAGSAAASATTLRFYRSDDAAIETSDEEVAAVAVEGLAASGNEVASVEPAAPSTPGLYHYGACVDALAGESDTTNNCSPAVRVTVREAQAPVQAPQDPPAGAQPPAPQFPTPNPEVVRPNPQAPPPDLVAEPPSVREETNSEDGASFRIIAEVRNDGGRRSGWTTVRVYYSRDETITKSDTQAFAAGLPPVRPSKRYSWSLPVRMPSGSGVYYYVACADAVAEESDTTNNCSAPVRVTVPASDLVAGASRGSDADLAAGGVFVLNVSLRNAGDRTSAATTVRVYRSDDATFTTSDPQVHSFWMGGMYPRGHEYGNSRVWGRFVRTPSSTGDYYYRACADVVADESDATNNCSASLKVEVTHAKPNLHVSKGGWNSHAGIGYLFRLSVRVRNLGGGPSAATTLRAYLLPDETSLPSSGTEVAAVAVPPLATLPEDGDPALFGLRPRAPLTPGRYYYVACVDAVADESDTTDNCTTPYWVDVVR